MRRHNNNSFVELLMTIAFIVVGIYGLSQVSNGISTATFWIILVLIVICLFLLPSIFKKKTNSPPEEPVKKESDETGQNRNKIEKIPLFTNTNESFTPKNVRLQSKEEAIKSMDKHRQLIKKLLEELGKDQNSTLNEKKNTKANKKNKLRKRLFPVFDIQYPAWTTIDFILRIAFGFLFGFLWEKIGWNGFWGFFIGQFLFFFAVILLFKTDRV